MIFPPLSRIDKVQRRRNLKLQDTSADSFPRHRGEALYNRCTTTVSQIEPCTPAIDAIVATDGETLLRDTGWPGRLADIGKWSTSAVKILHNSRLAEVRQPHVGQNQPAHLDPARLDATDASFASSCSVDCDRPNLVLDWPRCKSIVHAAADGDYSRHRNACRLLQEAFCTRWQLYSLDSLSGRGLDHCV